MAKTPTPLYETTGPALVRAARVTRLRLPAWPPMISDAPQHVEQWLAWLRAVWDTDEVSEVIEQASPAFARHLDALCSAKVPDARQARRTLVSVIRYIQRITGRATPNGLFSGITPAGFAGSTAVEWGTDHRVVARADGEWLREVIARLEGCEELLFRLPVVVNNTVFVRGDRLVVPYPSGTGVPPAEVSLRCTPPVRVVLEMAQAPIVCARLAEKLSADFPQAPADHITDLLGELLRRGVLLTNLHSPSTTVDALAHLVDRLEDAQAEEVKPVAAVAATLRDVRRGLIAHNAASPAHRRRLRAEVRDRMAAVADTPRQLAVDLRLDGSVTLPRQVVDEVQRAASALAVLSPSPFGARGWRDYYVRFFEKYGVNALVPLRDVLSTDVGLGFPPGFLGAEPERREPAPQRDQLLAALAQSAVLDGCDEIVLDDEMLDRLRVGDHDSMQVPPHLEMTFQVCARSRADLDRGRFALHCVQLSRGAGTFTGRFLSLLTEHEREAAVQALRRLPVNAPGALPVQLSFPPLDRGDAHVIRTPAVLSPVLPIAEHHEGVEAISLDDLAVGGDRRRMYLVSLSRGCLVEPQVLHALDLRAHAAPIVRFLAEISRASSAAVTGFSWGSASTLPYLPRVRYGRAVLAEARWLMPARDLPGRDVPWSRWHAAVDAWRSRHRMPQHVALTEGDQLLPLDLGESAHRAVLRAHLARSKNALLAEAAGDCGWFDGRAHEVTVPLAARTAPRWPAVPPVTRQRLLNRGHGRLPAGGGPWLLAKIYSSSDRHSEILAHHLLGLWARWETPPLWWFIRYQDPRPHFRLRIAVPDDGDQGAAMARISAWADGLRRQGLAGDLQFATSYPETGRWGAGPLMRLAEDVFAADSRAVVTQLRQGALLDARVLAAANFCSLAIAFTGHEQAGMQWLATHAPATGAKPLDRKALADLVRIANPVGGWAALRAEPGGDAVAAAWEERDEALRRYRQAVHGSDLDLDVVIDSLLHCHHIRATGIDKDDELTCTRLARAAAKAWLARREDTP